MSTNLLREVTPCGQRPRRFTRRGLCHAPLSRDARSSPDGDGTTPLYTASVNGEAEIARLPLTAGARPDTESAGPGAEGTPLCAAACWGHTETVRALPAHGADPNLREDHGTGRTLLQWALIGPHTETADRLAAAGAGCVRPAGRAAPRPGAP
ncbi:ankyrin repeat domain-containing protein [Streptomyces griseofuscus]|uniref:ankyrin repeat domain-containing protein n=1 Tax=Streptomyces griseofuscus TaxID=146922 RepID=UPI0036A751EF